ncbi:MAG: GNAT family N-acetyltransferase [Chloroflexi bacterium]|nr:GNAT family N-acetyltransferase [Chloroflexota bacterium]
MAAHLNLPRSLGSGLILRWATPADTEELAAFNLHIHSDNPEEPEEFLVHWVRDLMRGDHPTTQASDFTVVVDENANDKIVSSLNLIGQTWTYEGIPFGVGRPELVGTDEAYRRRGLVRAQFEAIHALSAARGHIVQAITGIPWYYRQFGYEMTVNLGGGRLYHLNLDKTPEAADKEPYQVRPAVAEDMPVLAALYEEFCAGSLLARPRDEQLWQYEMFTAHRESEYARHVYMVETAVTPPQPVAYIEYGTHNDSFVLREISVQAGHSWRAVGLFLIRYFSREALRLNLERQKPLRKIVFRFGSAHRIYDALPRELPSSYPSYAWYIRTPDLPGFLRHITPVLERRLAASVMAGHTGEVKVTLYRERLTLGFENGRLTTIGSYESKRVEEGDAAFPEHTFLHMLFGHRSLEELRHVSVDCWANEEATVLLPILFPKRPSYLVELG